MRRHSGFQVNRDDRSVKEEKRVQLHIQGPAEGSKKRILYTFDWEERELFNSFVINNDL
jgi:hypothetical protein